MTNFGGGWVGNLGCWNIRKTGWTFGQQGGKKGWDKSCPYNRKSSLREEKGFSQNILLWNPFYTGLKTRTLWENFS